MGFTVLLLTWLPARFDAHKKIRDNLLITSTLSPMITSITGKCLEPDEGLL
jgi:hypothetical protein